MGMYKFLSLPRAMFAADGNRLLCTYKKNLMSVLEALPNVKEQDEGKGFTDTSNDEFRVTIIDGITVVKEMERTHWIKTCEDISNHFLIQLHEKAKHYVKCI